MAINPLKTFTLHELEYLQDFFQSLFEVLDDDCKKLEKIDLMKINLEEAFQVVQQKRDYHKLKSITNKINYTLKDHIK